MAQVSQAVFVGIVAVGPHGHHGRGDGRLLAKQLLEIIRHPAPLVAAGWCLSHTLHSLALGMSCPLAARASAKPTALAFNRLSMKFWHDFRLDGLAFRPQGVLETGMAAAARSLKTRAQDLVAAVFKQGGDAPPLLN
jgi:hypothetical protein